MPQQPPQPPCSLKEPRPSRVEKTSTVYVAVMVLSWRRSIGVLAAAKPGALRPFPGVDDRSGLQPSVAERVPAEGTQMTSEGGDRHHCDGLHMGGTARCASKRFGSHDG